MRTIGSWWLGLLLFFLSGTAALAQEAPDTSAGAVPAVAEIALSAQQPMVPLSGRSLAWVDPTGFRTVDQVEALARTLPWTVHERTRHYDLADKALWIQFDAASTDHRRWLLQVAAASVPSAQLFYRAADGTWAKQEAGTAKAVSDWPVPGRYPTFQLSPATGKSVRYWLRIQQEHLEFASPLRLYESATLLGSRDREQFVLGAYFGLAALIALAAAANALAYRDRNFGVFSLYVAALAAGQLAAFGLGQQHLWDGWSRWNETAMFLLPGISSAAGLWFARNVTEPARFSRALDLAVWSVIAAILSATALDTMLASPSSYLLLVVLTAVGIAVVTGLIVLIWAQGVDRHIGLIALGFLPILLMGLLTVLAELDLLSSTPLTRDGLALGAALGLPVLFYALGLRGSHRREAEVRAAALARDDVLTGIAHVRTLLQRLEGAIGRARALKQQCALMTLKISNFEALAAEFGRETADRALVVAASLLRRAATDIDLEARVGDHHFALLLEGPTTTEHAMNRAQELVARGLRSSTALPAAVTIKFQVAVALLPHEQLDAKASLKWLLDAVNGMAPDARKLIRPMNF